MGLLDRAAEHGTPKLVIDLTVLFRVAYAVCLLYGAATAALFLRSANPQLDDQAPLVLLRQSDVEVVQERLAAATRSFLEG